MNHGGSGRGPNARRGPKGAKRGKVQKNATKGSSSKHTHNEHKRYEPSPSPTLDSDKDLSDSDNEGSSGYRKGGYHPVRIGEKFKNGRYIVRQKLGWGHFSTVWLVDDTLTGGQGALKVQKSASQYTEAARDEIDLLTQIRDGDPDVENCCCQLLDWFEHHGTNGRHMCMVFEVLGDNLLKLIKRYNYKGIPLPIVRNVTRQVLIGLDYLERKCKIIHTDLKPENVMLSKPLVMRKQVKPAGEVHMPKLSVHVRSQEDFDRGPPLTKSQKKRMKRKLKKAAEKASAAQCTSPNGMEREENLPEPGEANGLSQPSCDLDTQEESCSTMGLEGRRLEDGLDSGGVSSRVAVEEPCQVLTDEDLETVCCKIVDFGNACWTYKHFTSDIQTRQYRSPEVLLGAKYCTSADMWSLACMVFELVTGDFLFDPRSGEDYCRDEDHLALFIELLGKPPRRIALTGKYARDFFNRNGELRNIKHLKYWPLDRVLVDKYKMPLEEALGLTDFLLPMLHYDFEQRATARELLGHPWLRGELPYVDPESSPTCRRRRSGRSKHAARSRPPFADGDLSSSMSGSRSPKRARSSMSTGRSAKAGHNSHSASQGSEEMSTEERLECSGGWRAAGTTSCRGNLTCGMNGSIDVKGAGTAMQCTDRDMDTRCSRYGVGKDWDGPHGGRNRHRALASLTESLDGVDLRGASADDGRGDGQEPGGTVPDVDGLDRMLSGLEGYKGLQCSSRSPNFSRDPGAEELQCGGFADNVVVCE
ncbi:unnamed protein product [Ostreobium quekettii]|uniref:non-specific serine/threonine protein kinase n=1 Tax=Ostreobium quekettii TaxID=121088 RepID=A0A8S1J4I4_9CHLO|nr:unnamed protein product [Ostreobium quekettii]|eukprot:evm.model.scf_1159.1 EVM.evm.TU.scf_1159.1   scf_1159:5797-8070(+)